MRHISIRFVFQAIFIATAVAAVAYADGDRGRYSGFGARLDQPMPVVLETNQPMPHVTVTAYLPSQERVDSFHVVDEEASVRFRLMGLPADADSASYRVSWKFDEGHQGSDEQALRPAETSTVNVRYNTNNSSHRLVELRVMSSDGRWSGKTSFPVSGRKDSSVDVADGNVLLVPMKIQQTIN